MNPYVNIQPTGLINILNIIQRSYFGFLMQWKIYISFTKICVSILSKKRLRPTPHGRTIKMQIFHRMVVYYLMHFFLDSQQFCLLSIGCFFFVDFRVTLGRYEGEGKHLTFPVYRAHLESLSNCNGLSLLSEHRTNLPPKILICSAESCLLCEVLMSVFFS